MPKSLTDEEIALAAGYILGDLDTAEESLAEQQLRTNPSFAEEVNALRVSLQLMPHALPKTSPSPSLRSKILRAHDAELASKPRLDHIRPGNWRFSPGKNQESGGGQGIVQKRLPWTPLLAVVAMLAALLLGWDNLNLRSQLKLAQTTEAERVATLMQNPKSRLVALTGEGDVPAAGTLLFTAGNWQEVIVSIGNLPALPPDQVYRMWLALENGDAIYCGEFRPEAEDAIFIQLTPPEQPPKGVKTTGIFVTVDQTSSPLEPHGQTIIRGNI